jgi:hypothetical protein
VLQYAHTLLRYRHTALLVQISSVLQEAQGYRNDSPSEECYEVCPSCPRISYKDSQGLSRHSYLALLPHNRSEHPIHLHLGHLHGLGSVQVIEAGQKVS